MSSNHSIGIDIKAGVQGQESVAALTVRLDDMAKVLKGDLQLQAQQAAQKLRELAQQQEALNTFERLKRESVAAAAALKSAEKEVEAFGRQIAAAGPPTAQEAAALQKLQTAADTARQAVQRQNAALTEATAELQRHGVAATSTQAAQQRLAAELAQTRANAAALAPAYQSAAASSVAAGETMVRTHRAVGEGVSSISEQLQRVQNGYLALQGLGGLGAMIGDVARTADAYNSLAGRIKLVTGEGKAFEQALAGVQQVAIETRSDLDATAQLFTKILEIGKASGMSQEMALSLTQTINQAIQITGGSAASASAAITQLVQGLQLGVVRGDEFNSIMEQAPRLAQAMADGLGVTKGELRGMAEQGQLSAEAVLRAMRMQSEGVAAEFAKLPPTIGGALQNLSTAWMVYVGETDKASGASKTAAQAINLLAKNLDGLIGLLGDVAQAGAGFIALRLAQHFMGVSTAAQAAAVQVAASATAMKGAEAAAVGAGAGVSRFAGLLAGLRAFTLVGLVTNFKDIGTWIGESAAKLMGYKDRTAELAAQEAALNKELAERQALRQREMDLAKAHENALFGVSKAGAGLIAQFDELTKKGTNVDEAISQIGKKFDLASLPGIQNAAAVLDKLKADGKLSAEQFQQAWADALKGQDLLAFETKFRASMLVLEQQAEEAAAKLKSAIERGVAGAELKALETAAREALSAVGRETERTAQVMDATLREAIQRAGLDFAVISGGMSKASVSALNDIEAVVAGLDRMKAQGIDTGTVLSASISKAINSADSQKSIDAVIARIESLRSKLGDKVTDGLLDDARMRAKALNDELDRAKPGINSLAEAMKVLGVTSQKSLDETATKFRTAYETMRSSGTATARELQDGFLKYAEAAIKANGGVASESLKTEAALRGVELSAENAGRAIVNGMTEGAKAAASLTGSIESQTAALERQNATIKRANAAREEALALERKRLNVDKDGFTLDSNGNRQTMGGQLKIPEGYYFDHVAANQNARFRAGLSDGSEFIKKTPELEEEERQQQAEHQASLRARDPAERNGNAGYSLFGPKPPPAPGPPRPDPAPTPSPRPVPAPAPAPAPRVVHVNVTLTLNGSYHGTVPTDDQGAGAIQSFVEHLSTLAKRSNPN